MLMVFSLLNKVILTYPYYAYKRSVTTNSTTDFKMCFLSDRQLNIKFI